MPTVPGFAPSRSGLHYPNAWPHVPDLEVPTPFGTLGLGDAANGLCGGMAYAVADLHAAGSVPPPSAHTPDPDSPAFHYIVRRLFDSFDIPAGIATYYAWMNLPRSDWPGLRGTSSRTVRESMPAVRARIDAGQPCPLGLVCVHSADPNDLGRNHQVLAYAYEDSGGTTTVSVYDCNHPDRDDVTITFDSAGPGRPTAFAYSTGDHEVLGFFDEPYTAHDPAPLFLEAAPTPVPAPA